MELFLANMPNKEILTEHPMQTTMLLVGSFLIIYLTYLIKKWLVLKNHFVRLNIPGPTPLPIVGNMINVIRRGVSHNDLELTSKYGKTFGYFEGITPILMTTDAKLIKSVIIKDFSFFINRRVFDPLVIKPMDKMLTVLKNDEWKNVRSLISTTFTSGKLKLMSKHMIQCSKNLNDFFDKLCNSEDPTFETKTYFGSFTLDVISSTAFGLDTNSIADPNNELIRQMRTIFANAFNKKLFFIFLFPKICGFLTRNNIAEFFPMEPVRYIENLTNEIINRRKNRIDFRDDFIQYIIDHEEKRKNVESSESNSGEKSNINQTNWGNLKRTMTNEEILSQAIMFLIAGYDTTATTIMFVSYNMAMNPDYQEKLCSEIDEILENHDGKITYESVNEMKYMDMVIDETLRMYPPGVRIDRVANADYEYEGRVILRKDDILTIPIWALHRDPEIYPDPEQFRPERFSEEEKRKRDNEAYLPFGAGPRNCIGMRFALLEIKIMLATFYSRFQFEKCDKTVDTIILDDSGLLRPKSPIYLKVKRR